MTSIGCRCRGGNVHSRAILITQTLSGSQDPQDKTQTASEKKAAAVSAAVKANLQRSSVDKASQAKPQGRAEQAGETAPIERFSFRSFSPYNGEAAKKGEPEPKDELRWQ